MFILRRLARLSRTVQFALVAVAAFAIGSATVAAASTAGIPVGSLFYLPTINGTASTPCSTATSTLGATTTCNAIVDSNGNLHVSSTGTSTVSGSVSVSNLNADQLVHGMVGINNFPALQQVGGTVNVGNFPATQTVHVDNQPATQAVSGTVNVANLPATQAVNGTVNVGNLPTDANGNLNVNVVGGASAGGAPVATRAVSLTGSLAPMLSSGFSIDRAVTMNMTYVRIDGCSDFEFTLSGGGIFLINTPGNFAFPIAMSITNVHIRNDNSFAGCNYDVSVVGY